MLQVEELHESEVLQRRRLILEKCCVEFYVVRRPDMQKLLYQEDCVAILVFTHAVQVSRKQFYNCLKEMRANFTNSLR